MTDLAKRAVACRHWRWMPGMRILTFDAGHRYGQRVRDDGSWALGIDPLPDLTDPATLGCVLALVREAWDDRYLCASLSPRKLWMVDGWSLHDTEAEALVAALEAAP